MSIDLVAAATFVFWLILLLMMIGVLLFVAATLIVAVVAGIRAWVAELRGERIELPELPE